MDDASGRSLSSRFYETKENTISLSVVDFELATEITLMPIDQVGVDAAIIFSILVVLSSHEY